MKLVCGAARSGSLEVVEAALEATGLSAGGWVFAAAAGGKAGPGAALALCKRLLGLGCPLSVKYGLTALDKAAAAGNADVCEWLLAGEPQRCQWSCNALCAAARGGHADLVFWLQAQARPNEQSRYFSYAVHLMMAAAHGCSLANLGRIYKEWLGRRPPRPPQLPPPPPPGREHQQPRNRARPFGPDFCETRPDGFRVTFSSENFVAMLAAAARCPTEEWLDKVDSLMRWHCGDGSEQLLGSCAEALSKIFGAAMSAPDGLARVRLMWEQRGWRPADGLTAAVGAAAVRRDTEAVRVLFRELGARMEEDHQYGLWYLPLSGPVLAGDLAFLQLMLRTYHVPCSGKRFCSLVVNAAEEGHEHVVRWLLGWVAAEPEPEPEPPAEYGLSRRQCFTEALNRGLHAAVCYGSAAAVRCLLEQGARLEPGPPWWLNAVRSGSVATLRALAESGYAPNAATVYEAAVEEGDRRVVRELARLRVRSSDAAVGLLALLEDPDVPLDELRWLLEGEDGGGGGAGAGGGSAGAGSSAGGSSGDPAAAGHVISGTGRAGKRQQKQQKYRHAGRASAPGTGAAGAAGVAGEGPAAEALRYEDEWQRALRAVRGRGRGREARQSHDKEMATVPADPAASVTPNGCSAAAPDAAAEEPPYPLGEEPEADEHGMPVNDGGEGGDDDASKEGLGAMEKGLKAQPKPKAAGDVAKAAPAAAKPVLAAPPPARAPVKRALLIGCNYTGSRVQLAGCKNDTLAMAEVVAGFWQGGGDTHWLLDSPNSELDPRPTKANILAELAWLTGDLAAGDQLFLYYSGHGKQVADTSGDEADGQDEALVPLDYESAGVLTDDELSTALLSKIPAGAKLTIITDACHSGTVLDLPYRYYCNSITKDGKKPRKPYNFEDWTSDTRETTDAALAARYGGANCGSIVFYSSSQDEQTSATTIMAVDSKFAYRGAFTASLIASLKENNFNIKNKYLLKEVNCRLWIIGMAQRALLSSTQQALLDQPFSI
ncbi:hypothetical protein HYH02_011486 [Chlamydomonas schloesseri]|uniref:Peptidase C14 caspase domain-containing protein n=1 Tax=Chlamydomonas schloesseri TaxID=2026947 RepID=A0A835TA36_9CHLO|nr:hypothetical protein HYH02_011486 [Chlamydomonas schloesseri]|eukprot:KAG2436549.1 hypothetical protein HYH02_011486 [Chlamydomonas schloesseri]